MNNFSILLGQRKKIELFVRVVETEQNHQNTHFLLLKEWNEALEMLTFYSKENKEASQSDVFIFALEPRMKQKVLLVEMQSLEMERLLQTFLDVFGKRWRSVFKDVIPLMQIPIYLHFQGNFSMRSSSRGLAESLRLFLYRQYYLLYSPTHHLCHFPHPALDLGSS